jgi:HK97 family phage prohead protease
MPTKTEVRMVCNAELRVKSDGKTIEGYAVIFNSPSVDLGGFTEVCKPGMFARSIREKQDVRCLKNHDPNFVLGRTRSGTLRLQEDSRGLDFVCELPGAQYATDLRESILRGDIDGCSFGFRCVKDYWPDRIHRELLDVDIFDCGPVTYPAYSATSVSARSITPELRVSGIYPNVPCIPDVPEEERERLRMQIALARLR